MEVPSRWTLEGEDVVAVTATDGETDLIGEVAASGTAVDDASAHT